MRPIRKCGDSSRDNCGCEIFLDLLGRIEKNLAAPHSSSEESAHAATSADGSRAHCYIRLVDVAEDRCPFLGRHRAGMVARSRRRLHRVRRDCSVIRWTAPIWFVGEAADRTRGAGHRSEGTSIATATSHHGWLRVSGGWRTYHRDDRREAAWGDVGVVACLNCRGSSGGHSSPPTAKRGEELAPCTCNLAGRRALFRRLVRSVGRSRAYAPRPWATSDWFG